MTIPILQFQVIETYVSRGVIRKFFDWLVGQDHIDEYHFDVRIKIGELPKHLQLKEGDFIMLENGVRMYIWSRDRENMFKAKTYKMVVDDLRNYKPEKMFLVYDKTHGKITY